MADSFGGAGQALDLLKKHTHPSILSQSAFELVPAADHSFTDFEIEFADKVADWLTS